MASARVAVHAAEQLVSHKSEASNPTGVFALTRPPGHHAGKELCGGYCYVNNVVVAARAIQHTSPGTRVAILDIDYHHGNGTQSLTYNDPSVLYVSLHAQGDYPYFTGSVAERGSGDAVGTNVNIPLPMNTTGDEEYLIALEQASDAIQSYKPAVLLVRLDRRPCIGKSLSLTALTVLGSIPTRKTPFVPSISQHRHTHVSAREYRSSAYQHCSYSKGEQVDQGCGVARC